MPMDFLSVQKSLVETVKNYKRHVADGNTERAAREKKKLDEACGGNDHLSGFFVNLYTLAFRYGVEEDDFYIDIDNALAMLLSGVDNLRHLTDDFIERIDAVVDIMDDEMQTAWVKFRNVSKTSPYFKKG